MECLLSIKSRDQNIRFDLTRNKKTIKNTQKKQILFFSFLLRTMVGFSLYITLFCFFNIFLITHQLFDKKFQKKLFDVYLKEQDEADHYSPVVNSGHDPHCKFI